MILDIQDIINSVSVPALIKDEFIKKGTFARLKNGDLQACVGGFSIVFPVEVDGSKWAFRCWHHTLDNDQARIKLLSAELKKTGLSYFIDFEYEDKGIVVNGSVFPTTRMKWIKGRDIKDYICYNRNNRHKLFELASNFFAMTQDLHRLSIAHGDLQHENIIVSPYGKIYLIDYDSMYVPALSYMNSKNSTNGKDGYQHPARENCVYSNPTLDYFSEGVILTSILAIAYNPGLVEKYNMVDSDTMLFKKADFQSFASSGIYSDLFSMGDVFEVLLCVLSSYLKKRDITNLEPLEFAINRASPTNAISLLDYFKGAEINLMRKEKEAETQSWQIALKENSFAGYQKYLSTYPHGFYKEEAIKASQKCKNIEAQVLEETFWLQSFRKNTIEAYKEYIVAYPGGPHAKEASGRISEQEDDNCWKAVSAENTLQAFRNYERKYSSGRHIKQCKRLINEIIDNEAWRSALSTNTVEAYDNYLKRFTSPLHALEAKEMIKKANRSGTGLILGVFAAIAIVILVIITVEGGYNIGAKLPEAKKEQTTFLSSPENHSAEIRKTHAELDKLFKSLEDSKSNGYNPNPDGFSEIRKRIYRLEKLEDSSVGKYKDHLILLTQDWEYAQYIKNEEEVNIKFGIGDYTLAVSGYNTLITIYSIQGRSTTSLNNSLASAKECQKLLKTAEGYYEKQYFTKAIECYKKIKTINPRDPNIDHYIMLCEQGRDGFLAQKAIDTDWNNAQSLNDLYAFVRQYPNSKYAASAKEKIKRLEISADEERWRGASRIGTITSYEGYLARKTSYSQHEEDAKRMLAQLYEKEGNESFSLEFYSSAMASYKKAISNGGNLEMSENYQYCRFQVEDGWKTNSTAISDYLCRFPDGIFTSTVRGYKVQNEVRNGHFEEARREVNSPGAIYDGKTYHDKKWWLDYIKKNEREHKRRTRR